MSSFSQLPSLDSVELLSSQHGSAAAMSLLRKSPRAQRVPLLLCAFVGWSSASLNVRLWRFHMGLIELTYPTRITVIYIIL